MRVYDRLMRLSADEIQDRLAELPGWEAEERALVREFKFKGFAEAFGFMAAVAVTAEKLNHHPDWSNVYSRVTIRLSTHREGGITPLDFELAKHCSDLFQTGA
jgi:4a-hydroxytetrahydrobiopterin dehydratase